MAGPPETETRWSEGGPPQRGWTSPGPPPARPEDVRWEPIAKPRRVTGRRGLGKLRGRPRSGRPSGPRPCTAGAPPYRVCEDKDESRARRERLQRLKRCHRSQGPSRSECSRRRPMGVERPGRRGPRPLHPTQFLKTADHPRTRPRAPSPGGGAGHPTVLWAGQAKRAQEDAAAAGELPVAQ